MFITEDDEPAGLLQSICHDFRKAVADVPLAPPVGLVFKTGDRNRISQVAFGPVFGRFHIVDYHCHGIIFAADIIERPRNADGPVLVASFFELLTGSVILVHADNG